MLFANLIRKEFSKGDYERDKDSVIPSNIVRNLDLQYDPNHEENILDLYYRDDRPSSKIPVIISVHGGAWVYGDKEVYKYYCMDLAQRGFAVVNFTYRLAPEHKYPAALEDTKKVFVWVLEHAEEYNLDVNNIFAVGDSAGAHILSQYCAIAYNNDLSKEIGITLDPSITPKAVGLNCGIYQIPKHKRTDLTRMVMTQYIDKDKFDKHFDTIQVLDYMNESFPPTYIISANKDDLAKQHDILEDKLSEMNIDFVSKMYGTEENPLSHVFHCNLKLDDARIANDDELNFFKQHIL